MDTEVYFVYWILCVHNELKSLRNIFIQIYLNDTGK